MLYPNTGYQDTTYEGQHHDCPWLLTLAERDIDNHGWHVTGWVHTLWVSKQNISSFTSCLEMLRKQRFHEPHYGNDSHSRSTFMLVLFCSWHTKQESSFWIHFMVDSFQEVTLNGVEMVINGLLHIFLHILHKETPVFLASLCLISRPDLSLPLSFSSLSSHLLGGQDLFLCQASVRT